jgi:small subunit ribosomal protein S6
MTLPAPTYDLVLLLDPQADDATRTKLVADVRAAIEAQGEFLRHDEWGDRTLAYPIDRKTTAEYHLLQFHAATAELLNGLNRSLRIADEVLRFRLVKLAPGVPEAPDMTAASSPARRPESAEGESEPQRGSEPALAADIEAAPAAEVEGAPAADIEAAPAAEVEGAPAAEADAEMAVGEPS